MVLLVMYEQGAVSSLSLWQLMYLGWKILLPVGLSLVIFYAFIYCF